jgi:POT family proton-dependent oligopeptide transporter
VYLLSLPGGWIADRFLGQRRAVMIGGIGILIGNTMLALPFQGAFYPGLAMIAIGTGCLKPNVSTLVGQLYKPSDIRRDAGFTIYYMGINLGAGLAPFVGVLIAENPSFRTMLENNGIDPNYCWQFGFAVVAAGMLFGLIQYKLGWNKLGDAGLHPTVPPDPERAARDVKVLWLIGVGLAVLVGVPLVLDASGAVTMSKALIGDAFGIGLGIASILVFRGYYSTVRNREERNRVTAMIPLFLGAIGFFGVFEQASSTLSVYADRLIHREYLGLDLPASAYQFPNAIFIVLLATPFAAMWLRLAKAGKEPTSVTKFGIGMVLTALSFVVLLPTLSSITPRTEMLEFTGSIPFVGDLAVNDPALEAAYPRVSPSYLIALYFVSTLAELFISPVGLSSMSKLAPPRLAGMVMGTWFLATAVGNYIAGRAAGVSEAQGYGFLFAVLIVSALVIAAALFVVSPMIRRMLAAEQKD